MKRSIGQISDKGSRGGPHTWRGIYFCEFDGHRNREFYVKVHRKLIGGVGMPHVEIKCFPGRIDEQKKRCADKIAEDTNKICLC